MASGADYNVREFSKALESSFIQSDPNSDNRYAPRLLSNDKLAKWHHRQARGIGTFASSRPYRALPPS